MRLMQWGRGPLRTWSSSLLARWRLRYSAQGVIRWPASRPGGKNASFVLGRKVDTVAGLQLFQSEKMFISCRLSVYCRPGFSRSRRIAPSPGYPIAQRCSPGKR
ncbi:hypothetical protein BN1007_100152 [Klebsiella variicola]|nr:hypothetical protein BN1007_100152 [Klebsiella variicola]